MTTPLPRAPPGALGDALGDALANATGNMPFRTAETAATSVSIRTSEGSTA
jgi:hypothetical protein